MVVSFVETFKICTFYHKIRIKTFYVFVLISLCIFSVFSDIDPNVIFQSFFGGGGGQQFSFGGANGGGGGGSGGGFPGGFSFQFG